MVGGGYRMCVRLTGVSEVSAAGDPLSPAAEAGGERGPLRIRAQRGFRRAASHALIYAAFSGLKTDSAGVKWAQTKRVARLSKNLVSEDGVRCDRGFLAGVVMGTGSTITIKVAYGLNGTDSHGVDRPFEKPLTTTFIMFLAMSVSLPMFGAKLAWERCRKRSGAAGSEADDLFRPLPLEATLIDASESGSEGPDSEDNGPASVGISWRLFFLLLVPAFFDLAGTALAKVGLMHCSVSVYQLVRCTVIVFTSIAKTLMGKRLPSHMWVGVFLVTVAMVAVSASSLIEPSEPSSESSTKHPSIGILFLMGSCLVASLQYVFEEKVMSDDGAHPLVVVGLEGFWGVVLFVSVVFPWAYILPGSDVGSLENVYDSYVMLKNSQPIQLALLGFFVTVALYNIFAVYLTHLMSSIWHAILDCFRPVSVWATDLVIFYCISNGTFGEAWTSWSYLELGGMLLLFFGTAVFNGNVRMSCCPPPEAKENSGLDDDPVVDDAENAAMDVYQTPSGLIFTPRTPVTRQVVQQMPASSEFTRSPMLTRSTMRAAARWNRHVARVQRRRMREKAKSTALTMRRRPSCPTRLHRPLLQPEEEESPRRGTPLWSRPN